MKNLLFVLLIGFSCNLIYSQDIIFKYDGNEIKSKIVEISRDSIVYQEYGIEDGTLQFIPISEVFMVMYENGVRVKFTSLHTTKNAEEPKVTVLPKKYDGNYFLIGCGVGPSYGIMGVQAQVRFGGVQGFGFHMGVGFVPVPLIFMPMGSIGIKYYPYKDLYINMQLRTTGYESDWLFDYFPTFGSSFLIGNNFYWGDHIGIGFNPAIGFTYRFSNNFEYKVVPTFDLGFIIRF